jgi:ubiquitin carboxyl-terminal hydrolase 10
VPQAISEPEKMDPPPFYPAVSCDYKVKETQTDMMKLPWCSWHSFDPQTPFPPSARGRRPRRAPQSQSASAPLELPSREVEEPVWETDEISEVSADKGQTVVQATKEPEAEPETIEGNTAENTEGHIESQTSTVAAPSEQETPATSQAPSEIDSEQPTSPSSVRHTTTPAHTHTRTATRPVVPIIPKIPVAAARKPSVAPETPEPERVSSQTPAPADSPSATTDSSHTIVGDAVAADAASPQAEASPPAKAAPASWADLLRSKASAASASAAAPSTNGVLTNNSPKLNKTSSAEALRAFSVDSDAKYFFLKPRGLNNTGNMCYMNSVSNIPL